MNNQQGVKRVQTGGGGPGPQSGMPQLPPSFPPGVDPTTYQLEKVEYLLNQTAYLNMFAVDNPDEPDVPIPAPGIPNAFIGLHVHDVPHRFGVTVQEPTAKSGLRAKNV